MTMTVGMRELSRNSNILDGYDYVDVEDKKISRETQDMLDRIDKFAGKGKIYERFNNLSGREIRQKIAEEKYGE